MTRLALGAGLLLFAILTGWLAGSTGEVHVRAATRAKTLERVDWQSREDASDPEPEPAPVPVSAPEDEPEKTGEDGPASAQGKKDGSPEASDLVSRMRRHLPRLADWQADQIRRYQEGYKEKLRRNALDLANLLEADRGTRFDAVSKLREIKREREEFMRSILGRDAWEQWKVIETTGGRDVDAFLREMQARNN